MEVKNMLIKNKKWYKSKSVHGSAVALVLAVLAAMGIGPQYSEIIIAIASGLGLYGRAVATEQLSK